MSKNSKINTLPFDFGVTDTNEAKAQRFISKLQSQGFVSRHKTYLSNYVNADIGIAFAHIKNSYKTYVLEGNWNEEKFETVIAAIINNSEMLVPRAFFKYGMKFDNGQLAGIVKDKVEIKSEEELTNEELLEIIKNAGGGL